MNFSYDYEDLLYELKEDIEEFNLKDDDTIFVVRDEKTLNDYRPIVDYYLANNEIRKQDKDNIFEMTIKDIISEMETMNKIL